MADAAPPRLGDPLNGHYGFYGPPRAAPAVAEALRLRVLGLYERHLAPDGHALDYRALGADPGEGVSAWHTPDQAFMRSTLLASALHGTIRAADPVQLPDGACASGVQHS